MADWTEIDLRVAEYYAQERKSLTSLVAKYLDDHDWVTVRAAEDFGVPYNKVTPSMRRATKSEHFYNLYGRAQ